MSHRHADCVVSDSSIHDHLHADRIFRTEASREAYLKLERVNPTDICDLLPYMAYIADKHKVIYVDMEDVVAYLARSETHGVDNSMLDLLLDTVMDNLGRRDEIHSVIWDTFSEDVTSILEAQLNMDCSDVLMSDAFNRAMQDLFELGMLIENYAINAGLPLIDCMSLYKFNKRNRGAVMFTLRTHQELFDDNM